MFIFKKNNYIILFAGIAIMLLGYILMSGGNSNDPNVFDEQALYGFRRTILAPILVLIGLGTVVVSIFKKFD
jgi:hypothetical protein